MKLQGSETIVFERIETLDAQNGLSRFATLVEQSFARYEESAQWFTGAFVQAYAMLHMHAVARLAEGWQLRPLYWVEEVDMEPCQLGKRIASGDVNDTYVDVYQLGDQYVLCYSCEGCQTAIVLKTL